MSGSSLRARDPAGFAAARLEPVRDVQRAAARAAERGVVLLRAADVIRKVRRRDDVIELCGREILVRPGLAAVDADLGAAVVGLDHAIGVLRIDPEIVRVAVAHAPHGAEGLAAVGGLHERHVVVVDDVRVLADRRGSWCSTTRAAADCGRCSRAARCGPHRRSETRRRNRLRCSPTAGWSSRRRS